MIKNERQYTLAKARVADIDGSVKALRREIADKPPGIQDVYVAALRNNLGQTAEAVAEYEAVRDGDDVLEAEGLSELPSILIKARIRRGWTQKELAARLGLVEQQVQRWENNDYQGISFERLVAVAEALEVRVRETI